MESVKKKIKKAYATPRETENNGVLAFAQYVLLPASALKNGRPEFRVPRDRDGLEPLVYGNIETMIEDYKKEVVCQINLQCGFSFWLTRSVDTTTIETRRDRRPA